MNTSQITAGMVYLPMQALAPSVPSGSPLKIPLVGEGAVKPVHDAEPRTVTREVTVQRSSGFDLYI